MTVANVVIFISFSYQGLTHNLSKEAQIASVPLLESNNKHLEAGWPTQGQITIKDLSVWYRQSLPLTLENLSFSIPADSSEQVLASQQSYKACSVVGSRNGRDLY
jgi:ABC-type bacteriocin/lantibiotic exporter with double-glycine peptidase domain